MTDRPTNFAQSVGHKNPKTLLGIETAKSANRKTYSLKSQKPYQGLKLAIKMLEKRRAFRHKNPKTLSGIETDAHYPKLY